jgi:hypothetical protein
LLVFAFALLWVDAGFRLALDLVETVAANTTGANAKTRAEMRIDVVKTLTGDTQTP